MDLKDIKKQNKMLFRMEKRSGSCPEIKITKNIRDEVSKKNDYSRSNICISDSDSSFYSDRKRDKRIHNTERKEMNKLYHVVENTIKNKDQCNDATEYEPKFHGKVSLSGGTKDPIPVVTVSLGGGNIHRETIIAGLTCLWDSRCTNIMIKGNTINLMSKIFVPIRWNIVQPQGRIVGCMTSRRHFVCHNFLSAR